MPDLLFCFLRKRWIKSSPEEKIRQALINYLVKGLDYPSNQIIIEKNIDCLPHLTFHSSSRPPLRRLDLLIMAKNLHPCHPFYPLLLIECKATTLNNKALRQVLGYNHFLKACFVAVANHQEIQMGWIDEQQNFCIHQGLPPYLILLEQAKQMMSFV